MIPCEIAGPQVDEQGDRSCQREQQAKKTVEITVIQAADDQKQGSAQKQKAGGENGLGGHEMGPASHSSVTKWTVAPEIFTPYSRAFSWTWRP